MDGAYGKQVIQVLDIKIATNEDKEAIYNMSMKFLEASGYDWRLNSNKVNAVIDDIVGAKGYSKICLLLTWEEKPIGMLAAISDRPLFSDQLIAEELVWWVEPEYRGKSSLSLLEAYEQWAQMMGCTGVRMACLEDLNGNAVGRIYERNGYKKKESAYYKEFN